MNKQKIIQVTTAGIKITSALAGLAAYTDVIPPKYLPVCALVFAVVSASKEVLTALNVYLEGPASVQTQKVQDNLLEAK